MDRYYICLDKGNKSYKNNPKIMVIKITNASIEVKARKTNKAGKILFILRL